MHKLVLSVTSHQRNQSHTTTYCGFSEKLVGVRALWLWGSGLCLVAVVHNGYNRQVPCCTLFYSVQYPIPHVSHTLLRCILPYHGLDIARDACMGVIVQDVFCTVTNSLSKQRSLVDLFTLAVSFNSYCGGFSPGAFIAIRTCFPQALKGGVFGCLLRVWLCSMGQAVCWLRWFHLLHPTFN